MTPETFCRYCNQPISYDGDTWVHYPGGYGSRGCRSASHERRKDGHWDELDKKLKATPPRGYVHVPSPPVVPLLLEEEALARFLLGASTDEVADRIDELESSGIPTDVCLALEVAMTNTRDILKILTSHAAPGSEDKVLAEEIEKLLRRHR